MMRRSNGIIVATNDLRLFRVPRSRPLQCRSQGVQKLGSDDSTTTVVDGRLYPGRSQMGKRPTLRMSRSCLCPFPLQGAKSY
jgi:hypothetical protein